MDITIKPSSTPNNSIINFDEIADPTTDGLKSGSKMAGLSKTKSQNISHRAQDDIENASSSSTTRPAGRQRSTNFLFRIIKEAKDDSENPVKFVLNFYRIVFNSICFIISSIFITFLPFTMILIGFIYKDLCSIQKNIPVWLIVTGIMGLVNSLCRLVTSCFVFLKNRQSVQEKFKEPLFFTFFYCFHIFFLFVWFLVGNIWVYSVYTTVNFEKDRFNSTNYCNPVCYYFSFWSITVIWILIIVCSIFILSLVLYFACCLLSQWIAIKKKRMPTIYNIQKQFQ